MAPRCNVARPALFAACGAFLLASGRADLRVLQWNPHWQCFAWDANNCTQQAQHHLRKLLFERDLDFANIIEFEVSDFAAPPGWASVYNAACGMDKVDLMYNQRRWVPSRSAGSSAHGCMAANDRPFVIQRFDSTIGAGSLFVIGAHFPHPVSMTNSALEETMALKRALHTVGAAGGDERVILVADTNENENTPSHGIMGQLLNLRSPVISTSLEHTCCFDIDFKERGFDRVVANFGVGMDTEVLFDPVPAWAHEVKDGEARRGAFHKAILGTLALPNGTATTNTTSTTTTSATNATNATSTTTASTTSPTTTNTPSTTTATTSTTTNTTRTTSTTAMNATDATNATDTTSTTSTTSTTAASTMTTTMSKASAFRGSTTGTAAAAPAVPAKDVLPTQFSRSDRAMPNSVVWWSPFLVAALWVQCTLG